MSYSLILTLVLGDVQKTEGEHLSMIIIMLIYIQYQPFSKLDKNGIFNGIIRSPFIKLIQIYIYL